MFKLIKYLRELKYPNWVAILFFLFLGLLAYGLMIPWLGFYWDDWPFIYIFKTFGASGLTQYFATKRPFLAYIYQITMPIIGVVPWKWHIFGLVCRLIGSIAFWQLLISLWPRKKWMAILAASFFMVYPGFDQQYIPIAYSHYFITETFLFISLLLTIKSVQALLNNKTWLFLGLTCLAILASLVNLLTTEYFYLLDLIRPLFIWFVLKEKQDRRFKLTLILSLPYLIIFVAPTIWRLFFFDYQTYSYSLVFIEDLKNNFLSALIDLLKLVLHDWALVIFGAWIKAIAFLIKTNLDGINTIRYFIIMVVTVSGSMFYFTHRKTELIYHTYSEIKYSLMAAVFWIALAGWPFWFTGLPVSLQFHTSRFTLPYMPGVCLLLAAILDSLPRRMWFREIIAAILIGFSVGLHFQIALDYRQDWDNHTKMLRELTWRAPYLTPGTAIVGNYFPSTHYSDNSLTAPLNEIYGSKNDFQMMDYYWYYPEVRLGNEIMAFEPDIPIESNYLVATFYGSTSQLLVIHHHPRFCLRVLDPDLDVNNPLIPEELRDAAKLSNSTLIEDVPIIKAVHLPVEIYGEDHPEGWCYAFEKADLARQQMDWLHAAALLNTAIEQGDSPRTPSEWLMPIEVFAHVGDWDKAVDISKKAMTPMFDEQPTLSPIVCQLWNRIIDNTESSLERDQAWKIIQVLGKCD